MLHETNVTSLINVVVPSATFGRSGHGLCRCVAALCDSVGLAYLCRVFISFVVYLVRIVVLESHLVQFFSFSCSFQQKLCLIIV